MKRGFLILAQNNDKTDYVKCATILAKSIKKHMPRENVSIITNNDVYSDVFDNVINLPYGDLALDSEWKLLNDFQVYKASPYEYTIKIEADMYIPRNIDYWWDILENRDLNICTTIRNFKNEISHETYYRQSITRAKLVDVYNALTYFKKSTLADEFFSLVEFIFKNWDQVKDQLNIIDIIPTTDVVYSIAATYLGKEHCVLENFTDMSFIHMKRHINRLLTEKWYNELIYEINSDIFRIQSNTLLYPLHYHNKEFCEIIEKEL